MEGTSPSHQHHRIGEKENGANCRQRAKRVKSAIQYARVTDQHVNGYEISVAPRSLPSLAWALSYTARNQILYMRSSSLADFCNAFG